MVDFQRVAFHSQAHCQINFDFSFIKGSGLILCNFFFRFLVFKFFFLFGWNTSTIEWKITTKMEMMFCISLLSNGIWNRIGKYTWFCWLSHGLLRRFSNNNKNPNRATKNTKPWRFTQYINGHYWLDEMIFRDKQEIFRW